MHKYLLIFYLLPSLLLPAGCDSDGQPDPLSRKDPRPNILLIIADDLGYTDLGVYGGEIDTPYLNQLARSGVMFTNFHAAAVCSPTRSMLLSGTDNHIAGLGNMYEAMAPNQSGQPGYEGYLNFRVVSLAALLRDAGYHTYMTGKWHLGREKQQSPAARGFEKSFVLTHGGGGHFDDLGISMDDQVAEYRKNGEPVELPQGFYSTEFYTSELMRYIDADKNDDKPFFAYLAYTAPHWPLQAPDASIARQNGAYDEGYDVIHERRIKQLTAKGILKEGVQIAPRLPGEPAWDELDEDEKKIEARKMEIYAAMVEDMDSQIGRLLERLEQSGELDNTFIFFMSDNGAEGAPLDNWPVFGDWMEQCCDNSYGNMGKPDSYVFYGQNWGRVSTGPFRAYKGFTSQGGILVPAIASYPGYVEQGKVHHDFVSVLDIMPTLLELAGTDHPGTNYQGRQIYPLEGKSMTAMLKGNSDRVHAQDDWMAWEIFERRTVIQNEWKLLMMEQPWGTGDWQLYNLEADPAEQFDLTAEHPELVERMSGYWEQYQSEVGVIPMQGGTRF